MLPSALDAQFGTPYPRSAGFDTDIGAFIESSSMSSPLGLMDPTFIDGDAVQGETFLPGQIFVFGALHCGPIRLAIWSRLKVTPLATRSGLEA